VGFGAPRSLRADLPDDPKGNSKRNNDDNVGGGIAHVAFLRIKYMRRKMPALTIEAVAKISLIFILRIRDTSLHG